MEIEEIRRSNLKALLSGEKRGYAKILCDKVGCEPSYMSQLKTGQKNMGSSFARQLELVIPKPRGWFDNVHQPGEEAGTADVAFSIPQKTGNENHSNVMEESTPYGHLFGKVPLISWVTAGAWEEPVDNYHVGDAEDWLPCPPNCNDKTTFALVITGDSMDDGTSQGYRDGDMIFVDGGKNTPEHNADVVVKNGDGYVTFKRLIHSNGLWFLKPLNPNWPEKIIELDKNSHVIGRVMFSGRMR